MSCDELRESYELYSLGVLDGPEKREIEEHLSRGCAACQKHLKDALAMNALMLSQAPEVVAPSRLKRRVLAAVGIERAGWSWVAALAAACMLVLALWLGQAKRAADRELAQARGTLQQAVAERDQLDQALRFLNQPETRQVNFGQGQPSPPRGNFFLNPRLGVLLIASNLPPLPPGRTFEMWVIPRGGAPRPAGLFQSGPGGTALHILPEAAGPGATLAVTVEPAAGSAGPTSTPIFQVPVGL